MLLVLLLVVLSVAGVVAGARPVAADGLGLRPPPATRAEQERMGTWPR